MTSEADWSAALAGADGLSLLVNNAGIGGGRSIARVELADWRRMFAIHVEGALIGCQLALPLLRRAAPAAIVNIGSLAADMPAPGMGAYAAAKAALRALGRTLAAECATAGWDIVCETIEPGHVDTPLLDHLRRKGEDGAAVRARLAAESPAGRLTTPAEIAAEVVAIASR